MNLNLKTLPSLNDLKSYSVNRSNEVEGIRSSLYDFQTYGTGGSTQFDFFQVPQGQSGKTLADTNMDSAGVLPNPKHFLATNIQVYLFPSLAIASLGAPAAAEALNDIQDIAQAGYLEFFIGSKNYVQEAPIGRFPPRTGLVISSSQSDATSPAAGLQSKIAYGNLGGAVYELNPPILLMPTQNFRVSLKFPTAVPISASLRIGIVMEGILYRLSQ
jgi:hypothetical protein